MNLPKQYVWLLEESGPLMIKNALKLYGTIETPGKPNNPKILAWAKEVSADIQKIYIADAIPWCGLFMAVVAKRSKKQLVKDPLWALNWSTFGKYTEEPMLGDTLVFVHKTPTGNKAGHVGLYVGEDKTCYHVLGGNQSDMVCITRIQKSRLYTSRRPNYKLQPSNVRKIKLASTSNISKSEQ